MIFLKGDSNINDIMGKLISLTEVAGEKILEIFKSNNYLVTKKNNDDFDPLTEADQRSDNYLRKVIKELFPEDDILSEEYDEKDLDYSKSVWMIDPLDGTKDFAKGGDRFSIMIGRCEKGVPVLGIVYVPVKKIRYYAAKGLGAYKKEGDIISKLQVSDIEDINKATFFGKSKFSEPRPIEDTMKSALKIDNFLVGGSIGIILGEIAEGKGDGYLFTNPRAGKRDVCAPQIILQEAGGKITDADGDDLDFTSPGYKLKNYFIASNSKIHDKIINVSSDIYNK